MGTQHYIVQIGKRWVVTTNRYTENRSDAGILANFADKETAEAWLDRHLQWLDSLPA